MLNYAINNGMYIKRDNVWIKRMVLDLHNCWFKEGCSLWIWNASFTLSWKLVEAWSKVTNLIKRYCDDLDIKQVFSSFKIGKLFGVKDPIPGGLRSCVVYKFACAGCNACSDVGETTRQFSTRVREHLVGDKASHIFEHLQNSKHCRALCSVDCFHILDHASTSFQL